jgi:hypothetical protein
MPDIFNALFQITQRVEAKKDEVYVQEIQFLLMQLAKSEHEKAEPVSVGNLQAGDIAPCDPNITENFARAVWDFA